MSSFKLAIRRSSTTINIFTIVEESLAADILWPVVDVFEKFTGLCSLLPKDTVVFETSWYDDASDMNR